MFKGDKKLNFMQYSFVAIILLIPGLSKSTFPTFIFYLFYLLSVIFLSVILFQLFKNYSNSKKIKRNKIKIML